MIQLRNLMKNKTMRTAYLAWLMIALFYFYQYILRVAPGVLVDEIRSAFRITAEQFSTLGAFYLLGYSLLQIPLGVVVDRIGVKRMALYSITLCIIGSLLFGITKHFWVAQLSRFIIGIGSASAFMCSLKYVSDHFTPGNRGFLMGATLALGTVGALLSGRSLKLIGDSLYWTDILVISAAIGAIVFLLIWLFVKDSSQDPYANLNRKSMNEVLSDVWKICCDKRIVIYAILAIGLYTPLSALADLWGTAFIKQKYGLLKDDAAITTMLMYVGLTIGSLTLPWFAEKHNKINLAILLCGFGILITFSAILYLPPFDKIHLQIALLVLGFFCGAEMMCFTGALFGAKKEDSGEIIGVVNTFNMLGGAIVQWLIGWSLDKQWDGLIDAEGIRQYSTDQFTVALTSLVIVIFACCIISFSLLGRKNKVYKII